MKASVVKLIVVRCCVSHVLGSGSSLAVPAAIAPFSAAVALLRTLSLGLHL